MDDSERMSSMSQLQIASRFEKGMIAVRGCLVITGFVLPACIVPSSVLSWKELFAWLPIQYESLGSAARSPSV